MKPRFYLARILILALTLTTLAACSKGRVKRTDVVSRAYQMIDAQQPDQAIKLLERALEDEPENKSYKTVLASAYAHRAGFKVQKLVPILKQAQDFQRLQGNKEPGDGKVKAVAFDLGSLVNKSSALAQVFDSIPNVAVERLPDLQHAISILADLGPEINPSDAIYKAILEIILFKHYLVENLLGENPAATNQALERCQIQVNLFVETFQVLASLLQEIYVDLRIAHPGQTATFDRLSEETKTAVETALTTAHGVSQLDKNSLFFLKVTVLKAGFGKVLKCN